MFTLNRILFFLGLVVAMSSYTTAFFLNWGASETVQPTQPHYYYHQRLLQAPTTYSVSGNEPQPVPLPAIPIQVPLQAQLAAATNIHNVQLVPCLCPVSQDFEYDKSQQENVFFNQNANQHKNK